MKEGLRSSASSKRGKARARALSGGSSKGINLNSAKSGLFSEPSRYPLRSKGDHDASSDNADVGGKGFSLISGGLESNRDLVSDSERNVRAKGRYKQVAYGEGADHGAIEERESLLNSNGLDSGVKEEIRSPSLILNHSSSIVASSVLVSEDKVKGNASGSEFVECEKDADGDAGVCFSPVNNGSKNADVYHDAANTRHERSNGSQGVEREYVDCPRQEDVIYSNVTGDGELPVKLDGDASAVAEKGGIVESQMGGYSDINNCLKVGRVSPPASLVLDSVQESALNDADTNVEALSGSEHMECLKEADVHDDEVTVTDIDAKVSGGRGEGILKLGKHKRGMKRKGGRISECIEDDGSERKIAKECKPQFTERVLRSRSTKMSGGNQEVDSGSNGYALGQKRKLIESPGEDEFHAKINESDQQIQRPGKKLKHREISPKVQEEDLPSTLLQKEENMDTVVSSKVKLHGRPSRVNKEILPSKVLNKSNLKDTVSQVTHKSNPNDMVVSKKLKRRGRPPKVRGEAVTSHVIHKNKLKGLAVSKKLKRLEQPKLVGGYLASHVLEGNNLKNLAHKKVKRRGRPLKVHSENVDSHVSFKNELKENGISETPNDKRKKVQVSKNSSGQTEAKDACIGYNSGKSIVKKKPKAEVDMGRREQKQMVRDQINSMILDAGWTIEYRQRQSKDYQDAVYVDTEGKTHWSSTKAYRCLKKRIEDGNATSEEIAAFSTIPDEAFSTLFRHTGEKPRKSKKANKPGKGSGQTDRGASGKQQKKNKPGKKGKEGSKQKGKLTGDKSLRKKQVVSSLKGRSKPRLLARSSANGSNQHSDGFIPLSGKYSLLSWMISLGTILSGSKVRYGCRRKTQSFEGTVNRDGINCGCCKEAMSISNFVVHASGGGKLLGQALNKIFLESGTSLRQCMLDAWRKEEESRCIRFNSVDVDGDDPNDDTCNICADGGDLICCDGCPSTFHQSCLNIQNFPSGKWYCLYCSCKFCGMAVVNTPPENDSPDPMLSELLSCDLCEAKFHQSCSQGEEAVNVDSVRSSFCGRKCREIFEGLQMDIGVRHELEEGFSWTLLKCSDISNDLFADADALKVERNSKLAVAFSIMDECFVPIIDERSGINVIQNVIYNCRSNFRRLNYGGFCTVILERGDELISAASIRIHGNQVAEMPFIGTRNVYRRQGMCRRLLNAVESALGSLGVEKLVIPAITELFETWTSVFGFKPLEESKRQELKCMSLMVFPGTDMLEKPLLNLEPTEGNTIKATDKQGTVASELIKSVEVQSAAVNDGIVDTKALELTSSVRITLELDSKVTPKVTFDLNKEFVAAETDLDSAAGDSLTIGPQQCAKAYEVSDSGSKVVKPAGNLRDSGPCTTQALVSV